MKFKKILPLALVLAATLISGILTSCGDATQATSKLNNADTLRVAIQPFPLYAPIYVAKNNGSLESELAKIGVKVQWSSFNSGPLVIESFAAGQQDIGSLGDVPAIIAKASGQENIIVANASYGEKALAVLTKPDSEIVTASDLKGKKVAYVKGSYAHHLISVVLQNEGLTFDDIESINIPAGEIATALETGAADAGVLWEPFITKLTNEGRVQVLIDGTGIKRGNLVTIANEKYANQNPQVIETFLKVYNDAYNDILSDPKAAADLIKEDFNLTAQELVGVFQNLNYSPVIAGEDINELKVVESFLREQGLSGTEVSIDDFVDTTYLKNSGLLK